MTPLLTSTLDAALRAAARTGAREFECSLDLELTRTTVAVDPQGWSWQGRRFRYIDKARPRTVYYWAQDSFQPAARFTNSLIKLVPTQWGAPTFEIDGIKMLPTKHVSPFEDARRKVALIEPRSKRILDTCGGLGYFAAWCLRAGAAAVLSFEKSPDVVWLRQINPWSPQPGAGLTLTQGDVVELLALQANESFDAVLHDPPRFGTAGELYSLAFYEQLARVLKRRGKLYHYVGAPNRLTTGRDVRNEVATRLRKAGFSTELDADGVLAARK